MRHTVRPVFFFFLLVFKERRKEKAMLIVMELCYRLQKMVIQSRQGKPSCKCWANDKGSRQPEKELGPAVDLGED